MRLEEFSPKAQAMIRAQIEREDRNREFAEIADRKVRTLAGLPAASATEVEIHDDELRIRVPLRAWSLNAERSGNWWEHRDRTRDARAFIAWALQGQSLPGYVEPVEIEATSYGVRFDAGNDMPTVKVAIDVLVDLGVIEDDRAKFVRRLILNAPVPGGDPAIEIRVRPAPSG